MVDKLKWKHQALLCVCVCEETETVTFVRFFSFEANHCCRISIIDRETANKQFRDLGNGSWLFGCGHLYSWLQCRGFSRDSCVSCWPIKVDFGSGTGRGFQKGISGWLCCFQVATMRSIKKARTDKAMPRPKRRKTLDRSISVNGLLRVFGR